MVKKFRAHRTLMVQGTTSDAGKSALVTGLCRLLHDRTQALQAMAAGLMPHTD